MVNAKRTAPESKPDQTADDYDSLLSGWFTKPSAEADEADPFSSGKARPEHADALDRVREWTRQRFKLPAEAAILVSELECRLPGCPPLETVIAFWENDKRHHFKLFRPVAQVAIDDLPFTWMKSELIVPDDFSCECC
jgi:nitrate reductase delta subunit